MRAISIQINSKKDATNGVRLFPELNDKKPCESEVFAVGILEGGMESGATSVMLMVAAPDDSKFDYLICQMSAKQLEMLAAAVKGAEQRFKGK